MHVYFLTHTRTRGFANSLKTENNANVNAFLANQFRETKNTYSQAIFEGAHLHFFPRKISQIRLTVRLLLLERARS